MDVKYQKIESEVLSIIYKSKDDAFMKAEELMKIGIEGGIDSNLKWGFGFSNHNKTQTTWGRLCLHTSILFQELKIQNQNNDFVSLGSGDKPYLEIILWTYLKKPKLTCLDKEFQGDTTTNKIRRVEFDWNMQKLEDIPDIDPSKSTLLLIWPPADWHSDQWSCIPEKQFESINKYKRIVVIVDRYYSCGTSNLWKKLHERGVKFDISGCGTYYQEVAIY
jgi:hypothetical protein